jgi:hypothetical protein
MRKFFNNRRNLMGVKGVNTKTGKLGAPQRWIVATVIAAMLACFTVPASADVAEDLLNKLRAKGILTDDEYQELLQEVRQEQQDKAAQEAKAAEDAAKAAKAASANSGSSTGVHVKLGGFIESASIYRNENETADDASLFITKGFGTGGVPFANTAQAQTPEFRESARQSRVSLLITGNPDNNNALAAYFEGDFLGDAQTGNSNQSNSYTPRLRQAYATWDNCCWGLHFLAGQSWSLATQFKDGLTPRDENVPLTIDAQYVPGFNWLRVPGLRLVKDFGQKYWLGLSLETPAAIVAGQTPGYLATPAANANINPAAGTTFTATPAGITPGAVINETAIGGSLFNTANAYTTDTRPDVILKAAADPGWGHYEVYGLYRWFTDRVNDPTAGVLAQATTGSGINSTTTGEGIGGSVLLPVVPNMLSVSASFLTGNGIGRYGTSGLPDVTYNLNGTLSAIHETDFLFGAIFNPTPDWQIWGYYGKELADEDAFDSTGFGNPIIYANTKGVPTVPAAGAVAPTYFPADISQFSGYGLPLLDDYGCFVNAGHAVGTAANCAAVTAATSQLTLGAWWSFYKGTYGTLKWGASFSHTMVSTYAGVDGAASPDINIYMVSFRYYPFQ